MLAMSLAWIAAAGVLPASAQTRLALKFEPGEVVRQEMLESTRIDVIPPNDKKVYTTVVDQRWFLEANTVKLVDDGGALVREKFTRISVSIQLPPPVSKLFSVDSAKPMESTEKVENDMRAGFAQVIGKDWMLTFEPNGAIRSVALSDELSDVLVDNPQTGPLAETFTETGLRKLALQTTVTLPPEPVQPGDKWEQLDTKPFPEGKLITKRICTYVGPVENGLEKITVKLQAKYEENKGAKQPTELTENGGDGEVFFDPKAGRIVRSKFTQVLVMKMGLPDKQGTQRIKMVHTLLPAARDKAEK